MFDIPLKYALVTLTTVASGAASVISEHTLIPLGVFVSCTLLLCAAAWKVSSAVTKALTRLEGVENRLQEIEKNCKERGCQ